ncbi:MAG: hypothetical protein IKO61_04395 [Lachnospiraceae bacterium]|nr:hypothetical protein [Lachnospiraceae bacterium]
MLLTQRLLDNNRRINAENKKKNDIQQDQDEDEMGYAYEEPVKWGYLNDYKGVFADDDDNAINTAKSVFDKTAIFRTKEDGTIQ